MKRISLIIGLGMTSLLFVNVSAAFAIDTPVNKTSSAEVEVTKSQGSGGAEPEEPIGEPGKPGIGSGDFTINGLSDFNFGKIEMGKLGKAIVAKDRKLGLEVIDERGFGSGWNVQVVMGEFKSTEEGNKNTIAKGWKLVIPAGTVTSKFGDLANPPKSHEVIIDKMAASVVFSADKDSGLGTYTNVFMDDKTTDEEKSVRLSIPTYAKIGKYKADLIWVLTNAPKN
ncbi:WxL domain-containing protein [Enterococcus quebecensis]|uniref:WxL domain-containing protein n=1 Tax=Enterococcus quebecensis TaxID=903983 RepID=A0A1E5GTD4_9ENTE|nr:WxL domain-containing protein [Enterococcus quebecensis]OEG15923.1 hypothetical protein BCR23_07180 [Enterococcus quebecensis]OJG74894.1 hypothetical protein RV12_GL001939 [Enterococcus quebecensis]